MFAAISGNETLLFLVSVQYSLPIACDLILSATVITYNILGKAIAGQDAL
jgi:hypothetical protein